MVVFMIMGLKYFLILEIWRILLLVISDYIFFYFGNKEGGNLLKCRLFSYCMVEIKFKFLCIMIYNMYLSFEV